MPSQRDPRDSLTLSAFMAVGTLGLIFLDLSPDGELRVWTIVLTVFWAFFLLNDARLYRQWKRRTGEVDPAPEGKDSP